jgi:hypothetical protein
MAEICKDLPLGIATASQLVPATGMHHNTLQVRIPPRAFVVRWRKLMSNEYPLRHYVQQIARLSILNFALHSASHRRLLCVEQQTQENSAAVTTALAQMAQLAIRSERMSRSLAALKE